ncbi:hypothetical protein LC593_12500 [Nostoc sp. CHAB 5844]|nr:hypothetical protein [Nostoc sp. CHAB 5844]
MSGVINLLRSDRIASTCIINVLPCIINALPCIINVLPCIINVSTCIVNALPCIVNVLLCTLNTSPISVLGLAIAPPNLRLSNVFMSPCTIDH